MTNKVIEMGSYILLIGGVFYLGIALILLPFIAAYDLGAIWLVTIFIYWPFGIMFFPMGVFLVKQMKTDWRVGK